METILSTADGKEVSRCGLGCSRLGSLGNRYSAREQHAVLEHAWDAGINYFDTADVYAQGDSERILGRFLRGRREQALVSTKGGMHVGPAQRVIRFAKPLLRPLVRCRPGVSRQVVAARKELESVCFAPDYLRRRLRASLRRLRVDFVDIYFLHSPRLDHLQHSGCLDFLHETLDSGLARMVGVSVTKPQDAAAVADLPWLQAMQVPAGLWNPEGLATLRSLARQRRATVAREVLAGGVGLADKRLADLGGSVLNPRSPAEIALRYVLDTCPHAMVLCGTSCLAHLKEVVRISQAPALDDGERKAIAAAFGSDENAAQ